MDRLTSADMKYVGQPSPHLSCPICLSPLLVPVTASTCLHTFCNLCIAEALEHSSYCPVDRGSLSLIDLHPAHPIIRSLVNDLIVECPHRDVGCPDDIRRDALNTHLEEECMYTPTACLIEGCNTTLPLAEMLQHQDVHRIEFKLDTRDLDVDEHPASPTLSYLSPTKLRTERISLLNRNWSVLSTRSRLSGQARRSRDFTPPNWAERPEERISRPQDTSTEPFLARAINSYDSNELQELCFNAGDLLRIVKIREDGWWEGDHSDVNTEISFGGPYLIPSTFVEICPEGQSPPQGAEASSRSQRNLPTLSLPSGRRGVARSPTYISYPNELSSSALGLLQLRSTNANTSRLHDPHEQVLFYVQAYENHTASQEDDFDFQEGDIMAVTGSSPAMRGYLLDDARRQDQHGRNRIPSHRVIMLH